MDDQHFHISGVEALTAFRDSMKEAVKAFPDDNWTNAEVIQAVEDCLASLVRIEAFVALKDVEQEGEDD